MSVVAVMLSLLSLRLWIYFVSQTYGDKKKLMRWSVISGVVSGLSMVGYQRLVSDPTVAHSLYPFAFAMIGIGVLWMFLTFSWNKMAVSVGGLGSIIICLFAATQKIFFLGPWIEEYLKFMTANTMYQKNKLLDSDIILFGVISGLGFAFIENILYATGQISAEAFWGVLIVRSFLGFLVHASFSGTMGRGGYSFLQSSWVWVLLILGGGIFHMVYNYFVSLGNMGLILLLCIGGYIVLTRCLYLSDRWYVEI